MEIDTRELKMLERGLQTFARKSVPFATRQVINQQAFASRSGMQDNISRDMVNRNKYTRGSIRVDRSTSLNIDKQQSVMGSIAEYMDDQEHGTLITSEGKHGHPIPTATASNEGDRAYPRKRPRAPSKRLAKIRLANKRVKHHVGRGSLRAPSSKKHEFVLKQIMAVKTGQRFFFFSGGKRTGIYHIRGGRKKGRVINLDNTRTRMVYNLNKRNVLIPATPTMFPAVREVIKNTPVLYRRALLYQLRRHGLLF